MAWTVRGVEGALRWGYHAAGALGAWTVTKGDDGAWSLSATVVSLDTFKAAQRPLSFVATHATGAWRWPIETLEIQGAALTARLGPKERT